MLKQKIVFNITFHQQYDNLVFHIDNLFSWNISKDIIFVITSAHQNNLSNIKDYITRKYPDIKVDYLLLTKDHGYNLGTIKNVTEGIRYIKDNIPFDYLVNVEGDNMFYFEDKFIKIINLMHENTKHLLLVEEGYGKEPHTNFPHRRDVPKYFHFTTLNIFSKRYIDNCFPFEYYDDVIDIRWVGRPYTPYEAYMGLATMKKNNLSESNQMEFYNTMGLRLDYDRGANPLGWSEPDNMVPDKFLKWGMINAPSTAGGEMHADWTRMKEFIKLHIHLKSND